MFMPDFDVLIRTGWIVLWSIDLSVANIFTLAVVFPILFYLLLLHSINCPKRFAKFRSNLLRIRYLLVALITLYLVDYYLLVKAANQARLVANCFTPGGDHRRAVCQYFPIYEISLSFGESDVVFPGKVIRHYKDNFVFLNCEKVMGEILVTSESYVSKIIRRADLYVKESSCEIPLVTDRLRIY